MSYSKHGFEVVRGYINQQTLEYINYNIDIFRERNRFTNNGIEQLGEVSFEEETLYCFNKYGLLFTESLLCILHNKIEQVTNKRLYKTYSIVREYVKGQRLPFHSDRPSCEISATVQLKSMGQWPFEIFDKDGQKHSIVLNDGDFIIYNGAQVHGRQQSCVYEEHLQCFLHWVDADGQYSHLKYDQRESLGVSLF